MLALAASGLSALLYLLGTSYPYILGVSTLFVLVNMSVLPMSDAMALEFCTNNRFHFAPVRMCGTIGYAIMPVLLGGLFSVHLHYIFPTYCALCLIAATGTCFFPKSIAKAPVRASKSSEVRILSLLRDPFVIFLLTANFVISIGICAYTYLPLYASNMGYDNNLCGLLNAVAAMSEIPSLLLIDRVLKKIKGQTVIIASSFFCGLRLLITYLAGFCGSNAIWVMMLGQLLQSVSYITNYYCSAQLIHERFPAELKSTAQTLLAMITAGFSRPSRSCSPSLRYIPNRRCWDCKTPSCFSPVSSSSVPLLCWRAIALLFAAAQRIENFDRSLFLPGTVFFRAKILLFCYAPIDKVNFFG